MSNPDNDVRESMIIGAGALCMLMWSTWQLFYVDDVVLAGLLLLIAVVAFVVLMIVVIGFIKRG